MNTETNETNVIRDETSETLRREYTKIESPPMKIFACHLNYIRKIAYIEEIDSLSQREVWMEAFSPVCDITKKRRKNMRPFLCLCVPADERTWKSTLKMLIETKYNGFIDGSEYLRTIELDVTLMPTMQELVDSEKIPFAMFRPEEGCFANTKIVVFDFSNDAGKAITSRTIKSRHCDLISTDPMVRLVYNRSNFHAKTTWRYRDNKMFSHRFVIRGSGRTQRKGTRQKRKIRQRSSGSTKRVRFQNRVDIMGTHYSMMINVSKPQTNSNPRELDKISPFLRARQMNVRSLLIEMWKEIHHISEEQSLIKDMLLQKK